MATTSPGNGSLLQSTLAVIEEANTLFLEGLRHPGTIHRKGKIDLVTDVDLALEEYLVKRLAPLVPGAAILAEESAESTTIPERCWIIDPIDGTTNFSHGWPLCGMSVAYCEDGEICLGVISLPAFEECYYASQNGGAFRNGAAIRISAVTGIENALVATGFPYDIEERVDELLPAYRQIQARAQAVRQSGSSALDLAWVAAGRIDVYYERFVRPWDVAAGICIVREAGGQVTQYDGAPFHFEGQRILATNSAIHQEVVDVLRHWV